MSEQERDEIIFLLRERYNEMTTLGHNSMGLILTNVQAQRLMHMVGGEE